MIIYAAVARANDATVLAECSGPDAKGNFAQVALSLLLHLTQNPHVVPKNARKTFVQHNESEDFLTNVWENTWASMGNLMGDSNVATGSHDHYFHVCCKDELYFVCLGDDADLRDQKVSFALLDAIHKEFMTTFRLSRIRNANAYSLDKQFQPNMRSLLHYHNMHHQELARDAKVNQLMTQVEDLKTVMGRNINLMLDQQSALGHMLDKSETLQNEASVFKKRARTAKYQQMRKYYCHMFIIAIIVIILLLLAVIGVCGVGLKYCRAAVQNSNNGDGGGGSGNNDSGGGADAGGDARWRF